MDYFMDLKLFLPHSVVLKNVLYYTAEEEPCLRLGAVLTEREKANL